MLLQLAATPEVEPSVRARAEAFLLAGRAGEVWLRRNSPAPEQSMQTFAWGPDSVVALTFSRDGSHAIVVDDNGRLGIWSLAGNRPIVPFGTGDKISSAVLAAPDGRHVITGSHDGVVRAIGLHDRSLPFVVRTHDRPIVALLALHAEDHAASVSRDGTIARWSLRDGEVSRVLPANRRVSVVAALLAGDDSLLVSTVDGRIDVWDLDVGVCTASIDAGVGELSAVTSLPGTREILVAGRTGVVRVDPSARTTRPQPGPLGAPKEPRKMSLVAHPDGKRVYWQQAGAVDLYDLDDGHRQVLLTGAAGVDAMALSPDGSRLLTWHQDPRTIKLWDRTADAPVETSEQHPARVLGLAVDRQRGRMYTTSMLGGVRVWDLSTGAPLPEEALHGRAQVEIHHDGVADRVITIGSDSEVRVYDSARIKLAQFDLRLYGDPRAAVLADGRRLVTSGGFGVVSGPLQPGSEHPLTVRTLPAGGVVGRLVGHTDEITALAAHPDPARLVSAAFDRDLRLWDVDARVSLRVVTSDRLPRSIAVLPDGEHVLVGSQVLTLWNLTQGCQVRVFGEPGEGWIETVACDPRGELALALCGDHSASVWDLRTGALLARWYGGTRFGVGAFGPDGLVILGDDGGAVLFLTMVRRTS